MAAKKRGLGRGLDALLGGINTEVQQVERQADEGRANPNRLPLDLIQRGRY